MVMMRLELLIPIEKQNQSVPYPDILPDTWFLRTHGLYFIERIYSEIQAIARLVAKHGL